MYVLGGLGYPTPFVSSNGTLTYFNGANLTGGSGQLYDFNGNEIADGAGSIGISMNGNQIIDLNAGALVSQGNGSGGFANFFLGPLSGNNTTTGSHNTAAGQLALAQNTSGINNTANGAHNHSNLI